MQKRVNPLNWDSFITNNTAFMLLFLCDCAPAAGVLLGHTIRPSFCLLCTTDFNAVIFIDITYMPESTMGTQPEHCCWKFEQYQEVNLVRLRLRCAILLSLAIIKGQHHLIPIPIHIWILILIQIRILFIYIWDMIKLLTISFFFSF